MTGRKSVQQMLLEQEYSWRAVNIRYLKVLSVMAMPLFILWNIVDIGHAVYGFFGAEVIGYGPAQQGWYRVWVCSLILLLFLGYGAGVFGVIRGEKNLPSYRFREIKRLFYKVGGVNGIDMGCYCLLNAEAKIKNIKYFSGLNGEQVADYFLKITEKKYLPEPYIFYKSDKTLSLEKNFLYTLQSREGVFYLRGVDFNTEYHRGKVRWVIEVPWQAISIKPYTSGIRFYKHKVNWGKWELHFE